MILSALLRRSIAPRARPSALLALAGLLAGCVVAPPPPPPPPPAPPRPAVAAPLYFYPEQGQPEARQDRDRYECYGWAVRETGIDPGMTPVREVRALPPPPVVRDGGAVVAGAATGAVLGGAMSNPYHTGQGMVLGAIFGAAVGAAAQESRAQATERAYQQAQAQRQAEAAWARQPMDNFRRAISACMQGRGYRVG